MKVVYIAGPFRAPTPWLVEQNVRRAEAATLEVWKLGAAALCPHMNTRHFQDSAPDQVWIDGTLELLRRSDALLLLGTWEKSAGARGEAAEAVKRGMPVFHADEMDLLLHWIGGAHV